MDDDDIRKPLAFQEEEKPMATPALFKGPKTATTHGSVVMDVETDYVKPPICLKKRTCKDIALENKESSTALVRKEKLTGANILSGETKCNDDEKTKMKNKATRKALKIKNAKESTEQAITLATSTNQQSIVQHALSKKKPRKRKVEYVPSQEAKHANERSRSLVANDPHGCKHMGIFDIIPHNSQFKQNQLWNIICNLVDIFMVNAAKESVKNQSTVFSRKNINLQEIPRMFIIVTGVIRQPN